MGIWPLKGLEFLEFGRKLPNRPKGIKKNYPKRVFPPPERVALLRFVPPLKLSTIKNSALSPTSIPYLFPVIFFNLSEAYLVIFFNFPVAKYSIKAFPLNILDSSSKR